MSVVITPLIKVETHLLRIKIDGMQNTTQLRHLIPGKVLGIIDDNIVIDYNCSLSELHTYGIIVEDVETATLVNASLAPYKGSDHRVPVVAVTIYRRGISMVIAPRTGGSLNALLRKLRLEYFLEPIHTTVDGRMVSVFRNLTVDSDIRVIALPVPKYTLQVRDFRLLLSIEVPVVAERFHTVGDLRALVANIAQLLTHEGFKVRDDLPLDGEDGKNEYHLILENYAQVAQFVEETISLHRLYPDPKGVIRVHLYVPGETKVYIRPLVETSVYGKLWTELREGDLVTSRRTVWMRTFEGREKVRATRDIPANAEVRVDRLLLEGEHRWED